MAGLGFELSRLVAQTIPDGAYAVKVARNHMAFQRAAYATWFESAATAALVLAHTNAFYVRRDDRPRRGPDRDKPYIVAEVCIHDSTVRSEVNARREMLKLALAREGIHVEELRIVVSRWGMKERHPFGPQQAAPAEPAPRYQRERRKIAELQTLKRAFCLVFGEAAESVLDRVSAACLEEVLWDDADMACRLSRWYVCRLYSADASFERVIAAYRDALMAQAKVLGLNLRAVTCHPWTGAANARAFPVAGHPCICELSDEEGAAAL